MTDDWIQLLLSTLFGVLAFAAIGHRAARRIACARSLDAFASTADWRSTFASSALLDLPFAPAPADAPTLPRADVTRRRRFAALPPPFGPRPHVGS